MEVLGNIGVEVVMRVRTGTTLGPFEFTITDTNGPVDITAAVIRGQARAVTDGTLAATFVVDKISGTPGKFTVSIPANQTLNLQGSANPNELKDAYVFDIEMERGAIITPLIYGKLKAVPGVTRDD